MNKNKSEITKDEEESLAVGGQALIEGVMMRAPEYISIAVRRPNGEILVERKPFISITKRIKFFGIPILRGFIILIETMIVGIQALTFSADIAMEEERKKELEKKESKKTKKQETKTEENKMEKDEPNKTDIPKPQPKIEKSLTENLMMGSSMVIAFIIGLGLFFYLPLFITKFFHIQKNELAFNIVAGVIRISFFLIYLGLISMMKDIRRVFEYHGAEHKSIFMYEAKDELIPENGKKYTTRHPRCGTSFIFIVLISAILLYAVIDTIVILKFSPDSYPTWMRFIVHLLFLPLISGISYEITKLSGKYYRKNKFIDFLLVPGLSLQRITTKEPDLSQLEVAISALKEAIKKN